MVSAGLDFNVVYEEIELQFRKSESDDDQIIWITYIEESFGWLEEDYEMAITIVDRISALADVYRERLYRRLNLERR